MTDQYSAPGLEASEHTRQKGGAQDHRFRLFHFGRKIRHFANSIGNVALHAF